MLWYTWMLLTQWAQRTELNLYHPHPGDPHEWCILIGRGGMTIHKEQMRYVKYKPSTVKLHSLRPTHPDGLGTNHQGYQGDSLPNHPNCNQPKQNTWKQDGGWMCTQWDPKVTQWMTNDELKSKQNKTNCPTQLSHQLTGSGDQVSIQDQTLIYFSSLINLVLTKCSFIQKCLWAHILTLTPPLKRS